MMKKSILLIITTMMMSCSATVMHFGIDCELTFKPDLEAGIECQLLNDNLGKMIVSQLRLEHGPRGYRLTNRGKYIVGNIKVTKNGDRLYRKLFNRDNEPVRQYDKMENSNSKYYAFDNYCQGVMFMKMWIMTEYVNRYCLQEVYMYETDPLRMTDCLHNYATDPNYVEKINKILKSKQNGNK